MMPPDEETIDLFIGWFKKLGHRDHIYTYHSIYARKFLTKSQNLNKAQRRWILTKKEKWDFVKTSVSWINSEDKMDSCFILNFGYKAPLPWPQVDILLC